MQKVRNEKCSDCAYRKETLLPQVAKRFHQRSRKLNRVHICHQADDGDYIAPEDAVLCHGSWLAMGKPPCQLVEGTTGEAYLNELRHILEAAHAAKR